MGRRTTLVTLITLALLAMPAVASAQWTTTPVRTPAAVGPVIAAAGKPYLGTPYVNGGAGRFPGQPQNCHDFVSNALRDAFGFDVWGTDIWGSASATGSRAIARDESAIAWRGTKRSEVRPGDIVFFRASASPTGANLGHMAVMISTRSFQHSLESYTGKPNRIDRLDRKPWRGAFQGWVRFKSVANYTP